MRIVCHVHIDASAARCGGQIYDNERDLRYNLVPDLDVDHDNVLERLVRLVASDVLDRVDHVETGDRSAKYTEVYGQG
jgi:hypothetical protein